MHDIHTRHSQIWYRSLTVYDVMSTLNHAGVNSKTTRLWFKLKRNTEMQVKTRAAMHDTADVGDMIGQEPAGAALVSQLNIDQ